MKINDIISETTGEGSIGSGVFASVAFPLFGKRKMIRRAVDPHGYLESGKKSKKSVGYVNPVDTKGKQK
jgi:hypothetical protein